LSLKRNVFEILCRDLENRVRGPSRSLEMSPFDRVHDFLLRFYSNYGYVVSEIFNVEKCRELEIGLRGHEVIESGTFR